MRIQAGEVHVNGVEELRRGRQLQIGDIVAMGGDQADVTEV